MLRVALLDDHPAVLAGLRRLIESEPDLTVAAVASTAHELASELDGLRPDVLVLDYDLARDDGLSHCRRIKSRPQVPAVIIYSAYAGPALTLAARAAQADGVVDKAEPVSTLTTALRRVAVGEVVMSPVPRDIFEAAVRRLDDDDLPVFAMLLDREPVDSIADALRIDSAEVSWRAQRIVGRLRPGAVPARTIRRSRLGNRTGWISRRRHAPRCAGPSGTPQTLTAVWTAKRSRSTPPDRRAKRRGTPVRADGGALGTRRKVTSAQRLGRAGCKGLLTRGTERRSLCVTP
jgi:DNA-binding NarL/FixJ family response regulator